MPSSSMTSRSSKSGKGKGSKTKEGNQHYAAGHHQEPKAAQPKRRGDVHERGRIAVATTWWPFGHDAQGEELDHDPIEQFSEKESSEDRIELFSEDGSAGDALAPPASTARGLHQQEPEGDHQREQGGDHQPGQGDMELRRERLWELPTFQEFPYLKASDQWTSMLPGWMVRKHGKKRARLFHPLHRSTPKKDQLGIHRTTVLFLDDGTRVVKSDEWVSSHQVPEELRGQQWKGFTFFKLEAIEDNVVEGKGSGVSTPKQPQNEKGSNQKGTTSSKTNKKGSTEGTWLGVDDGSDENVVDDECDEVEDDENDGSFELVGDPVVPRHDTSHPSASTPLRGSKCTLGHPCEK